MLNPSLLIWTFVALLTGTAGLSLASGFSASMPIGEARLLVGSLMLLWSLLVVPALADTDKHSAVDALILTLLVGVCAGLSFLLWLPGPIQFTANLHSALGIALMFFAFSGCAALLQKTSLDARHSWWLLTLAAVVVALAPLWAGPLLETRYAGQAAVDWIIAASPLSYLAALGDWDYLRGDWFYRHTPFGGLRYDYPDVTLASLVYAVIGVAAHGLDRWSTRSHKTTNRRLLTV